MDYTDQATSLAVARIAIGSAAWIAPRQALRLGALETTTQAPYLLRLFGVRDVALGAVTLMAPAPMRPELLKLGMLADAADAAAGALAVRSGAIRPRTGAVLTGAAVAAVVAGAVALRRYER